VERVKGYPCWKSSLATSYSMTAHHFYEIELEYMSGRIDDIKETKVILIFIIFEIFPQKKKWFKSFVLFTLGEGRNDVHVFGWKT